MSLSKRINISMPEEFLDDLKTDAKTSGVSISEALRSAYEDEKNYSDTVFRQVKLLRKQEVNRILLLGGSRNYVNYFDSVVDDWVDHAWSNLSMKHLNGKMSLLSDLLHDTDLEMYWTKLLTFTKNDRDHKALLEAFEWFQLLKNSRILYVNQQSNQSACDWSLDLMGLLSKLNRKNVDDFRKAAFGNLATDDDTDQLLKELPTLLLFWQLNKIDRGESFTDAIQSTMYFDFNLKSFFDEIRKFTPAAHLRDAVEDVAINKVFASQFFKDLYNGFRLLDPFDTDFMKRKRIIKDADKPDKVKRSLALHLLTFVPTVNAWQKMTANFDVLTSKYLSVLPEAVEQMLFEGHNVDNYLLSYALLNLSGAQLKRLNRLPIQESLVSQALNSITTHRGMQEFVPSQDQYSPFDHWIKANLKFDDIFWQQELRALQKRLGELLDKEDKLTAAERAAAVREINAVKDEQENAKAFLPLSMDPASDDLPLGTDVYEVTIDDEGEIVKTNDNDDVLTTPEDQKFFPEEDSSKAKPKTVADVVVPKKDQITDDPDLYYTDDGHPVVEDEYGDNALENMDLDDYSSVDDAIDQALQDKRNYDALKPDPDADIKYKTEQWNKMRDEMAKSADVAKNSVANGSASAAPNAQASDAVKPADSADGDDLPM